MGPRPRAGGRAAPVCLGVALGVLSPSRHASPVGGIAHLTQVGGRERARQPRGMVTEPESVGFCVTPQPSQ